MYKHVQLFVLIVLFTTISESRIFSRCELANELYNIHGVAFEQVPTYVCIAKSVSAYSTTHQVNKENGIFGISDGYWCSVDSYGAGCQILCKDLRDDSISDDITCAKQIFRSHQKTQGNGFLAWGNHYNNCSNKNLTLAYVEGCF